MVVQHTAADFSTCLSGTCDAQSAAFLTTATLHWQQSTNIQLHNVTVQHTGANLELRKKIYFLIRCLNIFPRRQRNLV